MEPGQSEIEVSLSRCSPVPIGPPPPERGRAQGRAPGVPICLKLPDFTRGGGPGSTNSVNQDAASLHYRSPTGRVENVNFVPAIPVGIVLVPDLCKVADCFFAGDRYPEYLGEPGDLEDISDLGLQRTHGYFSP